MDETIIVNGHEVLLILRYTSAEDAKIMLEQAIKDGFISEEEDNGLSPVPYWTYGWRVELDGKQYGDFISLTDIDNLTEVVPLLIEQAAEVIKGVTSDGTHQKGAE